MLTAKRSTVDSNTCKIQVTGVTAGKVVKLINDSTTINTENTIEHDMTKFVCNCLSSLLFFKEELIALEGGLSPLCPTAPNLPLDAASFLFNTLAIDSMGNDVSPKQKFETTSLGIKVIMVNFIEIVKSSMC